MNIRTYQPGDETAQVDIYNAAAGGLPKFKPATVQEVRRRVRARDFDAGQRHYGVEEGKVVGYCLVNANGRVSYPWCLQGHEACAEPLFAGVLDTAKKHGLHRLFAAYRGDWPSIHDFFLKHGFSQAREMVNFLIEFLDLPTPSARASSAVSPLNPEDVAALFRLLPQAFRVTEPNELREHLFKNPYFTKDALFALRNRQGDPMAAGIVVCEPTYADPHVVDPAMPCFRLGAFGTEGMQTKRLKGLFSFVAKPDASLPALAMDLMSHAAHRLRDDDDATALCAQAASDVPALLAFYARHFKKQGSFPVFERVI
jgi:hypothetical protein